MKKLNCDKLFVGGKRQFFLSRSRGQSLLEYVILLGVVSTVFFAMFMAVKRGVQGIVRVTADQIGNQQNAEQNVTPTSGYLTESYSLTRLNNNKESRELAGNFAYFYNDGANTMSNSLINLGFTNKN